MKIESASGKEICLIQGINGEYFVRVYAPDLSFKFKDYSIRFSDLFATVVSNDICLYEDENGKCWIDHSPEVLGEIQEELAGNEPI